MSTHPQAPPRHPRIPAHALGTADVTAWGWVHLVLGSAAMSSGLGVLGGWGAARAGAVVSAACSAWASFYFLPYSPVVAPLVCALNVWVVASIMQPGLRRT